jgi:radical SAM superfamily enzyme YgiQ (UPF0313 family)
MKITFVYPDLLLHRRDWSGYFYVGIASLSTVLRQEGFDTSLIHVTKPITNSEFVTQIEKAAPDLIGFSCTSPMFPVIRDLVSSLVAARMNIPTICGGIHPTIAPDETIAVPGIDMICRGEGESALIELCRKLDRNEDISTISNIWVKKNGKIHRNPLRPLIDNLDELPFPDRSIFDYPNLYAEREGRLSFLVSRGCPYDCAYCCNHLMRKIYGTKGKPVRFRSVDNVISELKYVIQSYPFHKTVIFDDDILFLTKKWSEEFAERYSTEIKLPFVCNARANLPGKTTTDLLKKAGCHHIKFGLESGNEHISNKILNRHLNNEQIKRAFAFCKEADLITESFNMVGVPFDTPSTILDTIKLNAAISVDKMQVSIYQPYQGTKLADLCKEKNFVVSTDVGIDWFSPNLKLDTISSLQVLMFRDYFKILVRYYHMLQKLPAKISQSMIKLSDRILSFAPTAKVLNSIYIPLNYVYRMMLALKFGVKIFR